MSLGCAACPDLEICGGLHVPSGVFDCLSECCGQPNDCERVCRRQSTRYVTRVREVRGFDLADIPRGPVLEFSHLPATVPMIYHGSMRSRPFYAPVVALSLYQLVGRLDGKSKFANRDALNRHFQLSPDSQIMVSGTEQDPPLERWWALGSGRRETIKRLLDLGLIGGTSPNFSLFVGVPRWDNLHGMKRIGIAWQELISIGLPTALHLNARTDQDWARWTQFVAERPEVQVLSFEYATGAAWRERMDWHTSKLVKLAAAVSRPVRLVVRGGANKVSELKNSYESVCFIDTASFLKTVKRQKGFVEDGGLVWRPSPTDLREPLDDLLCHNYHSVRAKFLADDRSQRSTVEKRTEIKNPFRLAS
jgi:hypothetical protein